MQNSANSPYNVYCGICLFSLYIMREQSCMAITRVGNFIIGASGSDKQMLCASSGARAALNIAAEKTKQKR